MRKAKYRGPRNRKNRTTHEGNSSCEAQDMGGKEPEVLLCRLLMFKGCVVRWALSLDAGGLHTPPLSTLYGTWEPYGRPRAFERGANAKKRTPNS